MSNWNLLRAGLPAHDLGASAHFFGSLLGLGAARQVDERTVALGDGPRGLWLHRPEPVLARRHGGLWGDTGARHLAVEVASLHEVVSRLDRAAIGNVEAPAGSFDQPGVFALDPAGNVVAFVQRGSTPAPAMPGGWHLHHVNLPAPDVRETVGFYKEIAGMAEGRWRAPAARGDFSIDPAELAVLPLGDDNSGLHIIRPDPGFAHRNGFAHNPSIGGHPAFCVPSVAAVQARLRAAGVLVTDAGTYAMAGMHQLYVLDPLAAMVEVNQVVG